MNNGNISESSKNDLISFANKAEEHYKKMLNLLEKYPSDNLKDYENEARSYIEKARQIMLSIM